MQYKYSYLKTYEEFEKFFVEINHQHGFSFDTEGTSLDHFKNQIIGIGFSWEKYQAVYVPLKIYKPIIGLQNYWGDLQPVVLEKLKEILTNGAQKTAHNGKYDCKMIFHEWGFPVTNFNVDSMLLLSIVKSNYERFSLDAVSSVYKDLTGYKNEVSEVKGSLFKLPMDKLALYNNRDTDITYRIVEDNIDELLNDSKFEFLFSDMLMPLADLTMRMEYNGIRINKEYAQSFHEELYKELLDIDNRITQAVGKKINIRSSDQLGEVLFKVLKLPVISSSKKTGKPSTSKLVLKELLEKTNNPVLKDIITYRSLAANKGTFVDSFVPIKLRKDNKEKDYLLDEHGFYHGNYKLHSATGRLRSGADEDSDITDEGSNSLQLQNIPKDKRFRKLFLPDEGHVLFSYDFAQIELRILAHACQDKQLLLACRENYDLHSFVGGMVAGVPYEEVLKGNKEGIQKYIDIRNLSKNIGFGWVYGAADGKFAIYFPGKTLVEREANEKKAKNNYFERFNRILPYKKSIIDTARKQGFVRTISGRRIYAPEINSNDGKLRSHAERQVMNAVIQGPASDFNSYSIVLVDKYLSDNELDGRCINMIHDAGYFSINPSIIKEHLEPIKQILEKSKFGVTARMKIDAKVSKYWGSEDITKDYL